MRLAEEVAVAGAFAGVAGLQHQIDHLAERNEQVEEEVEEFLLRDGRGQHGHRQGRAGVAEDVQAEALPRRDRHVRGRADGVGQHEVAVAIDAQMGGQLSRGHGDASGHVSAWERSGRV